jgi:hypothetical protein
MPNGGRGVIFEGFLGFFWGELLFWGNWLPSLVLFLILAILVDL